MTAAFNQVGFIRRPEAKGIARGAAEAIAQSVEDRNSEPVSRDDLERVRLERFAAKDELQTALAKQVVQLGVLLGAGLALVVAASGVIVSTH